MAADSKTERSNSAPISTSDSKRAPIELVYDLTAPIVHNGSRINEFKPCGWIVFTPEQAWAYAVTFPLKLGRQFEDNGNNRLLLIRILLGAVHGEVDIALLSADGSRVLAQQLVDGSQIGQNIGLLGGPIFDCGHLVIRSGPNGAGGRIEIRRVETVSVDPRPEIFSPPRRLTIEPLSNWNRYYGNFTGSVQQAIRSWNYSQLKKPMAMDWLLGLKLWIYPDNELSRAIYVSGTYEPNILVILKTVLSNGCVLLDLGANVGIFSLIASRLIGTAGQIFAFEPSTREWQRLCENIKLNEISNVHIIKAAVAEHGGAALLHLADDRHSGQNTLGSRFAHHDIGVGIDEKVNLITIDDFVGANNITRVDVAKIDVEGAEYRALVGGSAMINRFRPIIIFEYDATLLAANGNRLVDLERFFKNNHYRIYGVSEEDGSLYPVTQIPESAPTNFVAYPNEKSIISV